MNASSYPARYGAAAQADCFSATRTSTNAFSLNLRRRALEYAMEPSRITVAAPVAAAASALARRRKQMHGLVLQMDPA